MADDGKKQNQSYRNLGGINTKISPYLNNVTEFRDLSNVDFRQPGSLTKRDGSTQTIIFGVTGPISGVFSLYSQKYIGNTLYASVSAIIATAPQRLYIQQGTSLVTASNGLENSNRTYFFKTYNNWTFLANGKNFQKFNGLTYRIDASTGGTIPLSSPTLVTDWDVSLFSLPPGPACTVGYFNFGGALNLSTGPWTGVYSYKLCWVNRRGFIGPPGPAATFSLAGLSGYLMIASGFTGTGSTAGIGFTVPASYAIGFTANNAFLGNTTILGSVNLAVFRTNGVSTDYFFQQYAQVTRFGEVAYDNNSVTLGITTVPTCIHFTLVPKFIEMYNNQMFMGGFTQAPNTIAFSDIGETESVQPEYNFEILSPLGDYPSGAIFYNGRLVLFKEKSVFILTGDNPENFSVTQLTTDYGCLNNAAAVYSDKLLFLDEKGVVEFNGANLRIISDRVEDIFRTMNLNVARESALMRHIKEKNQIWIAIPSMNSDKNDITVVYDYVVNAWTKHEGFNPSSFEVTTIGYDRPTELYGSYSGIISYMSASLLGDSGRGISIIVKSRFDNDNQEAVTKQYRQLYLDVNRTSSTGAIEVQFFPNYGTSSSLTRTMYMSEYQSRIDFGLPATSMQIQIKQFSSTERFQLHGWVLASRFQRKTGAFSQGE